MSHQTGFRKISPRDLELGDYLPVDGRMEEIYAISTYGPGTTEVGCPIRTDWYAVQVYTKSGQVWLGQPPFPGKK